MKRDHLLGEVRLPGVGLHHRGDRAAAVLLQQSLRRLPRMRRARHRAVLRAGPGGAGRESEPRPRRHRPLGAHLAPARPIISRRWRALARAYRQPMTKPWKSLPEEFRNVVLYGSGEDEINFTYDDGVRHYSTTKPFEGVINNIERRWRETEILLGDRGAVALSVGPILRGLQGLSPEAAGARGEDRGPAYRPGRPSMSIREAARWFEGAAGAAHAQAERDRRAHPQRDPRAARLPQRCRPRLSHALPRLRLAVGRREPEHQARLADRLGPHRRALCAGRAVHRAASARQCAAARDAEVTARHGQQRARGRARRGGDPHRRSCGGYGARRRHSWRRGGGRRHARTGDGQPGKPHRAISHRLQADPLAQSSDANQQKAAD